MVWDHWPPDAEHESNLPGILWISRDAQGQTCVLFLVNDETNPQELVRSTPSPDDFQASLDGRLDLREMILKNPKSFLTWQSGKDTVQESLVERLPESHLPETGLTLKDFIRKIEPDTTP